MVRKNISTVFPIVISSFCVLLILPLALLSFFLQTNFVTRASIPSYNVLGDLNLNGKVEIYDYNILVANFGRKQPTVIHVADINRDGNVDIFDYNLLVKNFTIVKITPSPQLTPQFNKKVFLLIFNPVIKSQNNKRLSSLLNWNDPDALTTQFITEIKDSSHNLVNYTVQERQEIDGFPLPNANCPYVNFTEELYLNYWNNQNFPHCNTDTGWAVTNYEKILTDYNICNKVNNGSIDEVWMFGGPYFGFYESRLAGPNAFDFNSSPILNSSCNKLLPIMGFSYERGVSEMLEDFVHRTESVMTKVYGNWITASQTTPWNKFTNVDKDVKNKAQCGSAHYPPNGTHDYDWSNESYVLSACENWYNYPNATKENYQILNCKTWNCNSLDYMKWWLYHLPANPGSTNNISNNWWNYIVNLQF